MSTNPGPIKLICDEISSWQFHIKPKKPAAAAGHLEGVIFWDLWLNWTHIGSMFEY